MQSPRRMRARAGVELPDDADSTHTRSPPTARPGSGLASRSMPPRSSRERHSFTGPTPLAAISARTAERPIRLRRHVEARVEAAVHGAELDAGGGAVAHDSEQHRAVRR